MEAKEHQKEVEKLTQLELELIELISESGSDELMDKFNEWQDQRNKCNQGFSQWMLNEIEEVKENRIK